jgi:DNA-binding transcriptional ArsR family regulator
MIIDERSENGFNIKFVYSPFFEMMCSLHVLTRPDHHLGRLNWASNIKVNMDEELYKEILFFGSNFFEWLGAMGFCELSNRVNDFNIIDAIDFISEISIEEYINKMLNERIQKEEISYHIKHKPKFSKFQELNASQLEIFDDPEAFRRRFLSCLKKYYYLFFEKELRFIEPLLMRIMKRQIELSKKIGILDYIKTIHPRIKLEDEEIKLIKYTVFNFPYVKLERVDFRISSYVAPHLLVDIQGKHCLKFTISANLEEKLEQVPVDLSKIMKALGDETRLKILRCLYNEKNSTQEVAQELGISEAAVSKHLKLMLDAGMLHKERSGNYIHYILNKITLDSIPMNLYEYLAN